MALGKTLEMVFSLPTLVTGLAFGFGRITFPENAEAFLAVLPIPNRQHSDEAFP